MNACVIDLDHMMFFVDEEFAEEAAEEIFERLVYEAEMFMNNGVMEF